MTKPAKIHLVEPDSFGHWATARRLVKEYAAGIPVDLCFQNFEAELAHLDQHYGPPEGAFLLAQGSDGFLGCVGLHKFSPDSGEMKRLYVAPAGRGRGVGRALVAKIIERAKAIGYQRIVLDTLPSMTEAQALYRTLGFQPIAPYRHNPVQGTAFLELKL